MHAMRGSIGTLSLRNDPDSNERFGRQADLRSIAFPVLWLFIGVISAFDTYLTVRFQEHLAENEKNPIGCLLLELSNGEPSLLVGVKFLGSTLVLGIITALYLKNRRLGFLVTSGLALFQLGLLGYLVLA
jgi:hypothetical protein